MESVYRQGACIGCSGALPIARPFAWRWTKSNRL